MMTNKRLLAAFIIGSSASMLPSVAIGYGIAQFKFFNLVGEQAALTAFSQAKGSVTLLLLVLVPLAGRLVDRIFTRQGKRYYWVVVGNILGLVSLYWFATASSVVQVLFAWLAILLSYTLSANAFHAAMPELIPASQLSSCSGIIGAAIPLCLTVNLLLIFGLLASYPLYYKLMAMGGGQLLLSMLAMGVIARAQETACITTVVEERLNVAGSSYRQFTLVVLAKLCISIAMAGSAVLPLYYATRFGLAESDVFLLNAAMAMGVVFILLTGFGAVYFAKKLRRERTFLVLGASFIIIGLLGYATASTLLVAIISGVMMQLGLGPINALGMALVNRNLPNPQRYGQDLAIVDVASHLGAAIVYFVTPMLVATGGQLIGGDGYSLLFISLLLFAILFVMTLGFIKPEQ